MSEPVSALSGATFEGLATIRDIGPRGMITLRGDLGSAAVKKAVKSAVGLAVPGQREFLSDDTRAVAWMSPDELLLLCPWDEADAAVQAAEAALAKEHALVVEVSDARAIFSVDGPGARECLAKLAPVDLSPEGFGPGVIRRSHLAQVPAAFWMTGPNAFAVVCFRSVAQYVFGILSVAAAEGSAVGLWNQQ